MSKTFRGGFIRATAPTVNTTSASGIFTFGDIMQYKDANTWPSFVAPVTVSINGSPNSLTTSSRTLTLSSSGYNTLTVNVNCTALFQLWGAGGGTGSSNGPGNGGAGGYVEGIVSLSAGTTYVALVGAAGGAAGVANSFPDGGGSITYGGGGGGSTRFGLYAQSGFNITNSAANYNNTSAVYFLIAGGGGGSANYVTTHPDIGAYGGGTVGAPGGGYYSADSINSPGLGGTQSAGGAGGYGGRGSNGVAGAKYSGGVGVGAGGGGGGYYGGGSGAVYYSTGGGGSGFINNSYVTSGTFYTASAGYTTNYIAPDPRSNKPTNAGRGSYAGDNSSTGYPGAILLTLI